MSNIHEPTIICPKCKAEIPLTESLAAPLLDETRSRYERELSQKDEEIEQREGALREREEKVLADARHLRQQVDDQVAEQLKAERALIIAEEYKRAKLASASEIEAKSREVEGLKEILATNNRKLADAQRSQTEFLKKQRELDDAKREMELTVEKRVQELLNPLRINAKQEAENAFRLKVKEKEETIAGMQRQIEVLKQRAEQGSQQLQGEVQEIELESLLAAAFPHDVIEPIPKGEHGCDIAHHVNGALGQSCGKILWEAKRTKNWSEGWLPKLRDDQRRAAAEVALIVSQALPKTINSFGLVDGVWVAAPQFALPLATALRQSLIEIEKIPKLQDGQQTKMALVYEYLTSIRFRHRVEAIVERFSEMQDDLDRERKTTTRLWAKREGQIRGVVDATAGMYGDLQGIAGKSLQEIEGLRFSSLGAPVASDGSGSGAQVLVASRPKDREEPK